jgi:ribonuclease R
LVERVDVPRAEVESALDVLESRGDVVRTRKGRISTPERLGLVAGRVRGGRNGKAMVITEDGGAPVALPRGGVRPAMNGDRVLVELSPRSHRGLRSGVVRKVLERRTRVLVGALETKHGDTLLIPRDVREGVIARVVDPPAVPAGSLVAAEILEYPTSHRDPVVRVTETLGAGGSLPTEIDALCIEAGIPLAFDAPVEAEAIAVAQQSDPEGFERVDLRDALTLTIDPEDAADHDDAIAIEADGSGYRLTVSIADVAHFVRPGSGLDREAAERGNSTYFPGRCIPMLPHVLSAGVASLKQDEDRRALSATLRIDHEGNVGTARFVASWIRSKRLLSYERAQALLDGDTAEDASLVNALQTMASCAEALRARRAARGALDLDIPESEIRLDIDGRPERIRRRPRLVTHRVIEEFMLAANEAVARHLEKARLPFLYRIHETPNDIAIMELVARLRGFGLRVPYEGGALQPGHVRAIIEKVRGRPEERVVNMLVLRSMQQARYSAYKAIHFGLASECYTHFTSPIRRYPDLLVHRALRASVAGDRSMLGSTAALESLADHLSRRERRSMGAEREAARIAAVLMMQAHVGRSFFGIVTMVDRAGIVVELENSFIEGFVPVGRLREYYRFVSERMELQSRTSARAIRLGDRFRVVVTAADVAERRLDFAPAGDD